MENATILSAAIKERIISRGVRDSDTNAWLVARRIGVLLKEKYFAEQVIVFGSLAKKAWTNYSDIDLAVRGIPADLFFKAFAEASSLSIPWTLDLIDMDDCFAEVIEEIEHEGVSI